MLEHRVALTGAVRLEAEARLKCEVFAEIMNGEITDVELDPIAPVFRDVSCVDEGHPHCTLDEDAIA